MMNQAIGVTPERGSVSKSDLLEVFAKTGHETLNALLLVSAGSVVTFLTFLGSISTNDNSSKGIDPTVAPVLLGAIERLSRGVVLCLGSYGASFGSHAFYYYDRKVLGLILTCLAGALWIASIVSLYSGWQEGVSGLTAAKTKGSVSRTTVSAVQSTRR